MIGWTSRSNGACMWVPARRLLPASSPGRGCCRNGRAAPKRFWWARTALSGSRRYRSLSRMARAITGTGWSRPVLFALKPRPGPVLIIRAAMARAESARKRCAIYNPRILRGGLEQEFDSLHAWRESCETYIKSQRHDGWIALPAFYDELRVLRRQPTAARMAAAAPGCGRR